MTDTDATRRRRHVADPLRELTADMYKLDAIGLVERSALFAVSYEIDREHERRMRQQSYDLRKAFCRYVGGIINDYKFGIKRKRPRK